jgi:16S rRNA (uracil1498-N3)-methyltransferase
LSGELWTAGNPALQTAAGTKAESVSRESSTVVGPSPEAVVLAVGPEGGFTPLELDQAIDAGARLVSLGPQILRVETAAIALVSVFTLCKPRS